MVYYAYEYQKKGYNIYSNLKLNFPYTPLTQELLFEYTKGQKQFNKAIFLIDEIYLFMDSRSAGSNKVKMYTYFILQTSKRNVNLFGSLQYYGSVDKRFRENCNFQCFCERLIRIKNKVIKGDLSPVSKNYEIKKGMRKLTKQENENLYIKNCFLNKSSDVFDYSIKPKTVYLKAKPIFNLYDTRELLAI